ncbi:MAG TPA: TlpA disulfide reductase family protein [Chloroflexota bacterium]
MSEGVTKAPTFELTDAEGRRYRLRDALSAGPLLLVFIKTGCPACHLAAPYLRRLREVYPQTGWNLWAISQDPADASRAFAAQHEWTFPVLVDAPSLAVSRAFDPPGTPTYYLIAPSGDVEAVTTSFSKSDLNSIAERIATAVGAAPTVVAPPGDGNPDFKPG